MECGGQTWHIFQFQKLQALLMTDRRKFIFVLRKVYQLKSVEDKTNIFNVQIHEKSTSIMEDKTLKIFRYTVLKV